MARQPNIIVCLCDQMRAFEVGCYGNPVVRTPHIDELAGQSKRFELAVTNAPVCMPARSVLNCGQYSRTCTGTADNYRIRDEQGESLGPAQYPFADRPHAKDTTLAEQLRSMGYSTAVIGKWHIHSTPADLGFEYSLIPKVYHRNSDQTFMENEGSPFVVKGFAPAWEAHRVKQFLQEHNKIGQPFFLYYNISPPHMPLADSPAKYQQMYHPQQIPLRPNVYQDGKLPFDAEWARIYLWDFLYYRKQLPHTLTLPQGFDLSHLLALYYGMCTWVDDLVGQLMKSLSEAGLASDTIVLFTSDHGDNLGSHGYWNKSRLIEESIRIPLMVRWPGNIKAGVNSAQVASLIDIMPTLLDLVGGQAPPSVQGRSLTPLLRGECQTLANNFAVIEANLDGIGIRTPTHLYGVDLDQGNRQILDGHDLFFDLTQDPYELVNLAEHSQQLELGRQLRRQLQAWHDQTPWLDAKQ